MLLSDKKLLHTDLCEKDVGKPVICKAGAALELNVGVPSLTVSQVSIYIFKLYVMFDI